MRPFFILAVIFGTLVLGTGEAEAARRRLLPRLRRPHIRTVQTLTIRGAAVVPVVPAGPVPVPAAPPVPQ